LTVNICRPFPCFGAGGFFLKIMKTLFWFVLLPLAALAALWYVFFRRPAASIGTVATTGTAGTLASVYPGWRNFTRAGLNSQAQTVAGTFNLLSRVSNAFGFNDGGTNPGVSTGGSAAGGIASSGAGAGVPTAGLSPIETWTGRGYFVDLYSAGLNMTE
jgi:hypothetical protein